MVLSQAGKRRRGGCSRGFASESVDKLPVPLEEAGEVVGATHCCVPHASRSHVLLLPQLIFPSSWISPRTTRSGRCLKRTSMKSAADIVPSPRNPLSIPSLITTLISTCTQLEPLRYHPPTSGGGGAREVSTGGCGGARGAPTGGGGGAREGHAPPTSLWTSPDFTPNFTGLALLSLFPCAPRPVSLRSQPCFPALLAEVLVTYWWLC